MHLKLLQSDIGLQVNHSLRIKYNQCYMISIFICAAWGK
jgi:hypothetical protein